MPIGRSGADLDVGANNGSNNRNGNVAAYGRVDIPPGGGGRRMKCTELSDLEIARLRAELTRLPMGVFNGPSSVPVASPVSGEPTPDAAWANTGSSDAKTKRN